MINSQEKTPYLKWGPAAQAGWQALPNVLMKNQGRLGLSATELVVLINLLSFWWYVDELPYPRVSTIANRMKVTTRTVQRALQHLARKGLVTKRTEISKHGEEHEVFDPEGLVKILQGLAFQDSDYREKKLEVRDAADLF